MPLIEKEKAPAKKEKLGPIYTQLDHAMTKYELGSPRRVKAVANMLNFLVQPEQAVWVARWVAKEGFGLTYAKPTWDNFCGRYWMFAEQAYSNVWEYPVNYTTDRFAQLGWEEAETDQALASKVAYVLDTYTRFLQYVRHQIGFNTRDRFYPNTSFLALWRGWLTGAHEASCVRAPVTMFANSPHFKQYVSKTLESMIGEERAAEFHGLWLARPEALRHDNVDWIGWSVGK
jgi:hypothetical protein